MKYQHLVLHNLLRRKVRTGLTIGSFAVALFLFGILAVVRGAFQQGVEVAGADRLVVVNKVSFIQPLPFAHRDRLARPADVIPQVTREDAHPAVAALVARALRIGLALALGATATGLARARVVGRLGQAGQTRGERHAACNRRL